MKGKVPVKRAIERVIIRKIFAGVQSVPGFGEIAFLHGGLFLSCFYINSARREVFWGPAQIGAVYMEFKHLVKIAK